MGHHGLDFAVSHLCVTCIYIHITAKTQLYGINTSNIKIIPSKYLYMILSQLTWWFFPTDDNYEQRDSGV